MGPSPYWQQQKKQPNVKALEELSQKFNISPNCVKRQLHSVRTPLTREIKKGNEDQKSKWKFYETVSFMKEDIVRSPKAEEVIEWSDEETEQFIEFYKQNDQLWNHVQRQKLERA